MTCRREAYYDKETGKSVDIRIRYDEGLEDKVVSLLEKAKEKKWVNSSKSD